MPKQASGRSGKIIVSLLIVATFLLAAIWVFSERDIPVLDKKAANKLIAHYEKLCRTQKSAQACKEIVGRGHTKCILESASKVNEEIKYSKDVYVKCLDKNEQKK